jgi:hypothetical protein
MSLAVEECAAKLMFGLPCCKNSNCSLDFRSKACENLFFKKKKVELELELDHFSCKSLVRPKKTHRLEELWFFMAMGANS